MGPIVFTLILSCCASVSAQSSAVAPCPNTGYNGKVACMLPDIYGRRNGEGALSGSQDFGNAGHVGHFDNGLAGSLGTINGDISQQLGLLPLASPGSGFSLTFDPALKTFVTSTDSLGPILSERADTVGKHRLAIGVSYQFFQFDKIDAVSLSNIPGVYVHNSEPSTQGPPGITCSPSTMSSNPDQNLATFIYNQNNNPQAHPAGSQLGDCSFVRDRFETQNSIKLRVHQITTYVTFGVTRNLDVSVVIPYVDVLFGVTSQAQIVTGTYYADHIFRQGNDGNLCPLDNLATPASVTAAQNVDCFQHNFPDNALSAGSAPASTPASGTATPTAGGATSTPAPSADTLYSNGLRDITSGKYDLARSEFQDYLKYYGDTDLASNAQFYLGEISFKQKQYGDAVAAYEKVLASYPKSFKLAPARLRKGMALIELGQKNNAVREFREVVRRYPGTEEDRQARAKLKELGVAVTATR